MTGQLINNRSRHISLLESFPSISKLAGRSAAACRSADPVECWALASEGPVQREAHLPGSTQATDPATGHWTISEVRPEPLLGKIYPTSVWKCSKMFHLATYLYHHFHPENVSFRRELAKPSQDCKIIKSARAGLQWLFLWMSPGFGSLH